MLDTTCPPVHLSTCPTVSLSFCFQVYKEDLPQLRKKLVGSLKRQKAPEEGLRLQFVHGYKFFQSKLSGNISLSNLVCSTNTSRKTVQSKPGVDC